MSLESKSLLENRALAALSGRKNLLAFSGGVDSSALFFMLMESGVSFDMAIVDYNARPSSKDEVSYAKRLSRDHQKRLFSLSVYLLQKNFEAEARRVRYAFFEELIEKEGYENLITAHQLNDRLEWFFMRFAKGAGIKELIGSKSVEAREGYTLVRPLLNADRGAIYEYLRANDITYFEDESNSDTKYERNFFRKEFVNDFIGLYKNGVRRSFEILEGESRLFIPKIYKKELLRAFRSDFKEGDSSAISIALKEIGYLPSRAQREEALKGYDTVLGGSFCVSRGKSGAVFVAPYIKVVMDKEFKEACRKADIPPKVRGYLFAARLSPLAIREDIDDFFKD